MKLTLVFIAVLAACILWPADVSQAVCPEDPNDNGACDTMYVEVYENDGLFSGGAHDIRVPIRVTSDIPNPVIDSIAGMVIPLCFTSSNAAANARLDPAKNNVNLHPFPLSMLVGSIFRHLPDMETAAEHNFLMDISMFFSGWPPPWNPYLDLSMGNNFWLSMVPTGTADQRYPGGSRVLTATINFTVDDTTTVCLDSCLWPPNGRLLFTRSDAVSYTPRTNLPYCFTVFAPELGDANADGIVDIGDVVYLISYLYRGGPPPTPPEVGDTNCDGIVDIGDVVRLIGYLYRGEPPPSC